MKCCNGFVTNSSSSSFVVCLKDSATNNDLVELLQPWKECVEATINEVNSKKNVNDAIKAIARSILDGAEYARINIDGWKIFPTTYSNEDCELVSCFMYDYGDRIVSDILKVEGE